MSSTYLRVLACICLLVVCSVTAERVENVKEVEDSDAHSNRVEDGTLEMQNGSLDGVSASRKETELPEWLEVELHVNQRPGYWDKKRKWKATWACWLLSVLEGLHYQGVAEKFYEGGFIQAEAPDDAEKIKWLTPNGAGKVTSGSFKIFDWTYRGSWQQIIETIFGQVFRVSGKEFQKRIGDAPKGGGPGRAASIQGYFQLIDKGIKVEGEMAGIHGSTSIGNLKSIFTPTKMGSGTATVWVIDKNGNHAISVHTVTPKNGWYKLETFNQAKDADESNPEGEYAVEPGKDGCYSMHNHKNVCDSIFKFTFTGLPQ